MYYLILGRLARQNLDVEMANQESANVSWAKVSMLLESNSEIPCNL